MSAWHDQRDALIDALARAEVAPDACNQYAHGDTQNAIRRANLARYLDEQAALRPRLLLVGEAPGYLGCRRTGIPFSSERLLLDGIAHAPLLGGQRGYQRAWTDGPPRGEQTASIIWGELAALNTVALAWNAFPFHPHQPGLPESNRKPRMAEVRQGQAFLRALLDLFPTPRVVAVGNTAHTALALLGLPHRRVRHPAQGGKHAFAEGLKEVVKALVEHDTMEAMSELPKVITIDGPAGAGKSTLGALLARRIGYTYFDTGVMYRAVTWLALARGLDPHDEQAMVELARTCLIAVAPPTVEDGRQYTVSADGVDITWDLRRPEVDRLVSIVAGYPEVRTALIAQQRAIAAQGRVVMVGRDIGTIVVPDAPLKIYLEASLEERARRRLAELQARGQDAALDALRAQMARRDALDEHVMAAAPDAIRLHNDSLSLDDEVERILALIKMT